MRRSGASFTDPDVNVKRSGARKKRTENFSFPFLTLLILRRGFLFHLHLILPPHSMIRITTSFLRASSSSHLTMPPTALLEIVSKTRVVEKGYSAAYPANEVEKGCYHRISHQSKSTKTKMIFGLFLPSSYQNDDAENTPVMFWLSGLTCDDTNFAMKAGSRAFDAAERHVSTCTARARYICVAVCTRGIFYFTLARAIAVCVEHLSSRMPQ